MINQMQENKSWHMNNMKTKVEWIEYGEWMEEIKKGRKKEKRKEGKKEGLNEDMKLYNDMSEKVTSMDWMKEAWSKCRNEWNKWNHWKEMNV